MTKRQEWYGKNPLMDKLLLETKNVVKDRVKALSDKGKKWEPEPDEPYYAVGNAMGVVSYQWQGDGIDLRLRRAGNCFKTKREAQAALRRVKKALRGE